MHTRTMQQVIFVRHGESVANAQMWLAGRTDVPLTPTGAAAARALSEAVLARGPIAVLSSDLSRARETAQLMLGEPMDGSSPRVTTTEALRERDYGAWEGMNKCELGLERIRTLLSWTGRPPGGESLLDAGLRAASELARRPAQACMFVVGHEGVLRSLLAAIDRRLDETFTGLVPNTTPVERWLPPGGWTTIRDELARVRGAA